MQNTTHWKWILREIVLGILILVLNFLYIGHGAPIKLFGDSQTIDPTNVGNITMQSNATMCFSGGNTCLSTTGISVNSTVGSANMYTTYGDQTIASTADVNVFNTTASNYTGTTTLPANFLTLGKQFTAKGAGIFTTPIANSATASLKIKMASSTSVTVASVTSPALIQSAAGWPYHWEYTCTVRATGATGTLQCDGHFFFATTATGADTSADLSGSGKIDTTSSLAISATNAWSTVAGGQSATEKETSIDWDN